MIRNVLLKIPRKLLIFKIIDFLGMTDFSNNGQSYVTDNETLMYYYYNFFSNSILLIYVA